MARSRLAEVAWGEGEEGPILQRWMKRSPHVRKAERVIRSRPTQDFDYLAFDRKGFPLAFVEVKKRRIPFGDFGDVMCPERKHDFALLLWREHKLPFLMVTQYACGTLVEVDLKLAPAEKRTVKRRDRVNPVPHAIWRGQQLVLLAGPEDDLSVAA